jgi:hypothetical protein
MNRSLNRAGDTDKGPDVSCSTLGDVLSGLEPSLPESLFGEECRKQMRLVTTRLPTRLSSFWGFECRLGEPEPFSDILFEIKKGNSGPALLVGERPSSLDELCEAHPTWEKFRSFARNWINPEHPWSRDVRNLWLEMDLAGADAESVLRRPNVFFGPKLGTSNERVFSLIVELMSMFERPISQAQALRDFLDTLPEKAKVFQIGFMLTRADDMGMRLCVDNTPTEPEKILTWFAKLWPAMSGTEAESLREIMEVFFPLCRELNFGFNLTENGASDAFGIECYEEWLEEDAAQWRPLLDELERRGLCLPEKARGVRDYAGITASPIRERIDGDIIYLNTYRKIHHLKLTLSRGTLTQAKAYLAVSRLGIPKFLFGHARSAADADRQAGYAWNPQ